MQLLSLLFAIASVGLCSQLQMPSDLCVAPVVTLTADGYTYRVGTSAENVAELLESLKISLDALDRTVPSPSTPITDGLEIAVTRVTRQQITEEVIVPSRVVVLAEPDLPSGYTKVVREGKQGRVLRELVIWGKNGEITSRLVRNEQVLEPVVDCVVLRGTRDLTTRGGEWRSPLVMEATAYEPGPRSCGRFADGYTSNGMKAQKGVVAVDDRVIPLGTRLYIPGYGFAVAADRGSAIKGMRIDLCFNTYKEAIQFGRRKMKVYVLD